MESILNGLDDLVCYMDGVVVCGDTTQEHDKRFAEVLKRVSNAGLKLNKQKCEFGKETLNFLGHKVSENGIERDEAKVQAIYDTAEPKDITELRRFLGMVSNLGRFVPNLAKYVKHLYDLLHKDAAWTWDFKRNQAFQAVKDCLSCVWWPCMEKEIKDMISNAKLALKKKPP